MPFKSESQKRKLQALVKDGVLSKKKFRQIEEETGDIELPDRLTAKPKRRRRDLKALS